MAVTQQNEGMGGRGTARVEILDRFDQLVVQLLPFTKAYACFGSKRIRFGYRFSLQIRNFQSVCLTFDIFASICRRCMHGSEAKIFGPERNFSVALTRFSRGCSHLPKAYACFESKNIQFGCKFSDKFIHQFVKIRTAATRRKQSCTL